MPRYYCDYCDTYLTHDAPSVRKQHNAGYKHKGNVRNYYQQYEAQLNQSLIDQKVKEHLGAYRPVAAPYPPLRPGLVLPNNMVVPGGPQMPGGATFVPGMRPPILPRPMLGAPGFISGPQMPHMVGPPGMPLPGQINGLQRPLGGPTMVPGSAGMPTSGGAPPMGMPTSGGAPPMGMPQSSGGPSMFTPPMYPGNVATSAGGSGDSSTASAQVSEANH